MHTTGDLEVEGGGAGVAADERPALAAGVAGVVVVSAPGPLEVRVPLRFQAAHHEIKVLFFFNIWWPMPLFLDIYFIYRYTMEVDEEKIYTYNISVGICLWFYWLDVLGVGMQLGCIGAVLM